MQIVFNLGIGDHLPINTHVSKRAYITGISHFLGLSVGIGVHLTIIPPKRCPVTAMGLKELLMEPVEMYFTRVFYIPGGAISLSSTVSSQLHHEI